MSNISETNLNSSADDLDDLASKQVGNVLKCDQIFCSYDSGATFTLICVFQTIRNISDELYREAKELRNMQNAITFTIMPLVVRHNTKNININKN